MFNHSAIMKAAWQHYRLSFTRSWIKKPVNRSNFAWCLAMAWHKAREAAMPAKEVQVARIHAQIERLSYKSLRYDTLSMRRRLEAELSALAA